MLIYQQTSYAPRIGRREAQSREPVNKFTKLSVQLPVSVRRLFKQTSRNGKKSGARVSLINILL
jgi:hypothetical protein